jgi:hypothetical protein
MQTETVVPRPVLQVRPEFSALSVRLLPVRLERLVQPEEQSERGQG